MQGLVEDFKNKWVSPVIGAPLSLQALLDERLPKCAKLAHLENLKCSLTKWVAVNKGTEKTWLRGWKQFNIITPLLCAFQSWKGGQRSFCLHWRTVAICKIPLRGVLCLFSFALHSFIQFLAFAAQCWHGTMKSLHAHSSVYHFHKGQTHFTCSNSIVCQMQMTPMASWQQGTVPCLLSRWSWNMGWVHSLSGTSRTNYRIGGNTSGHICSGFTDSHSGMTLSPSSEKTWCVI